MPFLDRAGRKIHYTVEGEGKGLVLIPGLGSGARLFGTLPRRFAREGFTCATVDPVGLPPSGPLPDGHYDFTQAALDVLAVAETLPGPVALLGTSLGGKVALRAAALASQTPSAHLDRFVMLCSSAVPTARARSVHRMFALLAASDSSALLGEFLAPFLFGASFHASRPAVVEDLIRAMKPSPESRSLMQAQASAMSAYDGTEDAQSCLLPALCLSGTEDTLTLPEDVAATASLLRLAEHETIAHAGHSLLLESAQALVRVLAFLQRKLDR